MKNIVKNTNKKGFTIVELVIVIAVIAILAGVLIPTFTSIIDKANQSAALQEAQAVYKEIYAVDISDGELDAKFGDEKLTKDNHTPITAQDNEGTPFVTSLTNAKITCKGTVTTYNPNADTGDKFVYEASNGETVKLTFVNGVETWTAA